MHRKFNNNKLLIASTNKGKVNEFENLFKSYNIDIEIVKLSPDIIEPEEIGSDFESIAILKSRYYSGKTNLITLSDDSGLCVDELGGYPGIHSARIADNGDFNIAIDKIEDKLKSINLIESSAKLVCAISLYWPDGHYESFNGIVSGKIDFPKRGKDGFGYDPIFTPNGHDKTFAEMGIERKLPISHRYIAFEKLIKSCFL